MFAICSVAGSLSNSDRAMVFAVVWRWFARSAARRRLSVPVGSCCRTDSQLRISSRDPPLRVRAEPLERAVRGGFEPDDGPYVDGSAAPERQQPTGHRY